jgi:hypothetical protein
MEKISISTKLTAKTDFALVTNCSNIDSMPDFTNFGIPLGKFLLSTP